MTTETYTVTGMTCGHCAASVTEEISELAGVETRRRRRRDRSRHRHQHRAPRRRRPSAPPSRRPATRWREQPMSTPLRVAAFVTALAAAFAVAWGGGRLVGPVDAEPVAHEGTADHGDTDAVDTSRPRGRHDDTVRTSDRCGRRRRRRAHRPRRRLHPRLADRTLPAGRPGSTSSVLTSSGRPLLDYTREHEKDLHLIVVRRDLTGFQHVHPRLDRAPAPGRSDVRLTPGVWRVVADFTPEGWDGLTLADDVAVPGDFTPAAPARPTTAIAELETDEGTYTVTLAGDTAPGAAPCSPRASSSTASRSPTSSPTSAPSATSSPSAPATSATSTSTPRRASPVRGSTSRPRSPTPATYRPLPRLPAPRHGPHRRLHRRGVGRARQDVRRIHRPRRGRP